MNKLWLICASLCVISSASSQQNRCTNGAVCVRLEQCSKLNNNMESITIKHLTSKLACDDGRKVCCTPNMYNLLPNTTICGIQTSGKIVGGDLTDIDEFPWMALLRYDKPKGHGYYCGGVLISSRYVLTAAHCINGSDIPESWRLSAVRLGEWNVSSDIDCRDDDCNDPVVNVDIEKVITHETYRKTDRSHQYDIALIRLRNEIPFTDFIKPVCLPLVDDLKHNRYEGWDMVVAGWGKTEKSTVSDVKLKVSLPIINHQECSSLYATASRVVSDKQLCAGGSEGKDSCRGDSGGPLMAQPSKLKNWFVFGVVSYGPSPCGSPGWPGVYTRVTAFTDWIISNIYP